MEATIVAFSRSVGAGLLTMTPLLLLAVVVVWQWAIGKRGRADQATPPPEPTEGGR